jgi:amidase
MKRIMPVLLISLLIANIVWAQSTLEPGPAAKNQAPASMQNQVPATQLDLASATIADLDAAFGKGTLTAEKLTALYLARIAAYDKQGPAINAVITLNPNALAEARTLDAERKAGKVRGPLHGVPIVLKDNYDTFDLPTTAGSHLLAGSVPPKDAFVVKKLRDAGAVILAKVNLSEFAAGGGSVIGATDPAILKAGTIANGFSSMGGQTLNPHDLARGPGDSSGGTGAAIAAAFAQFGLGTDTAGSIRGPSAANGIVGLKTTLGLISRTGIVPLASFDTSGPMARSVYDVAVVLGVMVGADPADASTRESAGKAQADYTKFLKAGSLKGARIGIGRDFSGSDPETIRITDESIATLKKLGAVIVDPVRYPDYLLQIKQPLFTLIRNSEFKARIADYLKTLKPGYPRTLDELIAKASDPKTGYRSPEKLVGLKYTASVALDLNDPVYLAAKNEGVAALKSSLQAVFAKDHLDAIIYPTANRPAALIKPAAAPAGDAAGAVAGGAATVAARGGQSSALFADESGSPEIIVPAGMTRGGLPVTISFFGQPYTEPKLLGYAYDFEQATHARVLPKNTPALPADTIPLSSRPGRVINLR